MTKKIVTILLMVSMMIWGTAFAGGQQGFRGPRPSDTGVTNTNENPAGEIPPHRPPQRHAGDLLGKYLHDNMMTEALSEITGQTVDDIKAELETKDMRTLCESYSIDRETIRTVMDSKTVKAAQQAANCGLITQDQATAIAQEIESAAATTETTTTETEPAN